MRHLPNGGCFLCGVKRVIPVHLGVVLLIIFLCYSIEIYPMTRRILLYIN
jgi:hypothetical protein